MKILQVSAFLALPVVEFLLWHSFFPGFKPSFPTLYAIVSVWIVLGFWIGLLAGEQPFRLRFRWRNLLLNGVSFWVFFPLTEKLVSVQTGGGGGIFWVWYVLAGIVFWTGLFAVISPAEFLKRIKRRKHALLFGILSGAVFPVYVLIREPLWPLFSKPTLFSVHALLRWSGIRSEVVVDTFLLKHPHFQARIASPCSGLEGMALFLYVLFLFVLTDGRVSSWSRFLIIALAGMFTMFALNGVRIALIFTVAVWAGERWGASRSSDLLVWAFHSHIGWITYLAGIGIFFSGTLRYLQGGVSNAANIS